MKKGIFALAMSAALMLAGTSALADYTFTVHHSGSTSHPYQKGSEYFNEKLTEYSNGTMNLDIRPTSGLLVPRPWRALRWAPSISLLKIR